MAENRGRKRLMKKAQEKPHPEFQVAQQIVASLSRVHMRIKKY